MIQALQGYGVGIANNIRLNLYDTYSGKTTMDLGYRPLISITSQQTGKEKNFMPISIVLTNKKRFVNMAYITTHSSEDLSNGVIKLGDDDFPYGFYNIIIRANKDNSNLDPSLASSKLYNGLLNLKAQNNQAVAYKEYTDNDSDTVSVYITNNIN